MSVLEDIVTEDGLWFRNLAGGLNHDMSSSVMAWSKFQKVVRMDGIEYTEKWEDVPARALQASCPHWKIKDEDEEVYINWGLPDGSYEEYVDRLFGMEDCWKNGKWMPSTERQQEKERAKDLTLASYLYPFRTGKHKSDPMVKHVILPMMKESVQVYAGTKALAQMIINVEKNTEMRDSLKKIAGNSVEVRKSFCRQLAGKLGYCMTSSSPNIYDAKAMEERINGYDDDVAEKGWNFALLADMVNTIKYAQRVCGRRRVQGKNLARIMQEMAFDKEALKSVIDRKGPKHKEKELRERIKWAENKVIREMRSNRSSGDNAVLFSPHKAPELKIAAVRNLAVVYHRDSEESYVFTDEDLKALKFVAMSHSMWHLYSSTIKIEYAPIKPVADAMFKALLRKIGDTTKTVIGQLGAFAGIDVDDLLMPEDMRNKVTQKEVTYSTVKDGLEDLWSFYIRILQKMMNTGMEDYCGKYLHNLFTVYTAECTGDLGKKELDEQKEDFHKTAIEMYMNGENDYQDFREILHRLPESAVQDFGRLSKIIYPYSINAGYAFLKRANDMKNPNPVEHVWWEKDGEMLSRKFTDEENETRKNRFRCGFRVMLTLANLRTNLYNKLDSDVAQELQDRDFGDSLMYARKHNLHLMTEASLLDVPWCSIPKKYRATARDQAMALVKGGDLPRNPWAGAYLDTENMLAYKKRDKPDLVMIKPTSSPPSDLYRALSSYTQDDRTVPCRDTEGAKRKYESNMVSEYLAGEYPSRKEAISRVITETPVLSTSVKIETNKAPTKNRIITAAGTSNRRVQSEYEYNNHRAFANMIGYCIGLDPSALRRKQYATMKDNIMPGYTRVMISLDLSSWSTGMDYWIQRTMDEEMEIAYDGGEDNFRALKYCTKNTHMIFSQKNVHLYSRNTTGANYEGLDGKRNTAMHCTLWYLARCDAEEEGLKATMRAFVYIDDGALSVEVKKDDKFKVRGILMRCMKRIYSAYGFQLSMSKTVVSENYMQFLNEVFSWGAHIGYGFRALCHTGAQSFPELATVREEIDVIVSGVRGAAVSGGHMVRLLVGMAFLLSLYVQGIIGNLGRSLRNDSPGSLAVMLCLPPIAGGFGVPDIVSFYSNVGGNSEIEQLSRCRQMVRVLKYDKEEHVAKSVAAYMKCYLMMEKEMDPTVVPDRLTFAHPAVTQLGSAGRDNAIVEAAEEKCDNPEALRLIMAYRKGAIKKGDGTFPEMFVDGCAKLNSPMHITLVSQALETDITKSLANLVAKIGSSRLGPMLLDSKEVASLKQIYWRNARNRANHALSTMRV